MPSRGKVQGWLIVLIAVAVFVFLYAVRDILLPFVTSAALAYIMSPSVAWLARWSGRKRWQAALLAYVGVLAVLAGFGWWVTSNLQPEMHHLFDALPEHIYRVLTEFLGSEKATFLGIEVDAQVITQDLLEQIKMFLRTPGRMAQLLGVGVALGFGVLLTLILLLYFLLLGPKLAHGYLQLLPPEYHPQIRLFATRLHPILFRYFWGMMVVVAVTTLITWVGVGPLFHLPHPLFLALATGILELLPVAGPVLSAALLGGTALLQGGSLWTFAGFALFCLVLRLAIDQFVGPLVLGKAMKLSPVTIIFAFLAGGALLGVLGVFLAVPVAAAIKILLETYYSLPFEE